MLCSCVQTKRWSCCTEMVAVVISGVTSLPVDQDYIYSKPGVACLQRGPERSSIVARPEGLRFPRACAKAWPKTYAQTTRLQAIAIGSRQCCQYLLKMTESSLR